MKKCYRANIRPPYFDSVQQMNHPNKPLSLNLTPQFHMLPQQVSNTLLSKTLDESAISRVSRLFSGSA